jgi:hypothetical protein
MKKENELDLGEVINSLDEETKEESDKKKKQKKEKKELIGFFELVR